MSLLRRIFGRVPQLTPAQQQRLDAWWGMPEPDLETGYPLMRYVVVDVESSGLDVYDDELIAIGAIAISEGRIAYDSGFYEVLRQERASSDDNILVHGIGGTSQTEGGDPTEILLKFLELIGTAPLVGFHAAFDEAMIRKAFRRHLGKKFERKWLDLAWLAPAILPAHAPALKSLDDWCEGFGVLNLRRHDALADALATAQLFQVLQQRASERGMRSVRDLLETARQQEWLQKFSR